MIKTFMEDNTSEISKMYNENIRNIHEIESENLEGLNLISEKYDKDLLEMECYLIKGIWLISIITK